MKILIKSAEIIDPSSIHHGKKRNVLIQQGRIVTISATDKEEQTDRTIEAKGMKLSTGWFDMRATFGDPGHEYKEGLLSGRQLACESGFTGLALLPNTDPCLQSKNEISYIQSDNTGSLTQLHAIGAVTQDTKGKELTEMIDLHHAGAVAFSDGQTPIWHTDILLKSLQYLQKFDGLLINRPEDSHLNRFGSMNEGISSTVLGVRGMPKLAEELMVSRDLDVLEYTGGRLHFSNISSAKSVKLIKKAKKEGLAVTCDIAAYQTAFEDSALLDFDTNYKVIPPFREKSDNRALLKGLKEGTIDVLVSNHCPQDQESKKLEFDLAEFGIIALQTMGHHLVQLSEHLPLNELIDKVSRVPRQLLRLPVPKITEGSEANLTLFAPKWEWDYSENNNCSRAENSPFLGSTLKGKAVATFNNGLHWIDSNL